MGYKSNPRTQFPRRRSLINFQRHYLKLLSKTQLSTTSRAKPRDTRSSNTSQIIYQPLKMSTTTIPASTEPLLSMKNIKFTNMHNRCGWEPRRNLATGDADFQNTIQNQCYGPPPLIQIQCVWKPRKDFITENMKYKGIHNQCLGAYCTDSTAETNGDSTQHIPQPRGQPTPTPSPPQSHFGSDS